MHLKPKDDLNTLSYNWNDYFTSGKMHFKCWGSKVYCKFPFLQLIAGSSIIGNAYNLSYVQSQAETVIYFISYYSIMYTIPTFSHTFTLPIKKKIKLLVALGNQILRITSVNEELEI